MPTRTFLRIPYLAAFLLAALLLGTAAASAASNTVKIRCVDSRTCRKTYTLKKLQTKEFRAKCVTNKPKSTFIGLPNVQKCYSSSSSVSCTETLTLGNNDYKTCSCTNWNVTKRKKAKVLVKCPSKVGLR